MSSLRECSGRLSAANRPRHLITMKLIAMMLIIVFFQGIHFSDFETAVYLHNFVSGNPIGVPRGSGQSLEGLLQDVVGMAFVEIGATPFSTSIIWWLSGLCFLAGVIIYSVASRSITTWALVLIVAFSHMVDSLSHYIGKFDPFTIGFLWLSVSNRRSVSISGSILAAFSHPFVALMSTAGLVCLKLYVREKLDWELSVVVLLAIILDVALFHKLFPTVDGRASYIFIYLSLLLKDAAHYGLLTLFSSIIFPISAILYFYGIPLCPRANQPLHLWRLAIVLCWAGAVVVIACVLTLDHTRISFLLTLAPLLLLTQLEESKRGLAVPESIPWGAFWIIFVARLTMGQAGWPFFQWHDLRLILS